MLLLLTILACGGPRSANDAPPDTLSDPAAADLEERAALPPGVTESRGTAPVVPTAVRAQRVDSSLSGGAPGCFDLCMDANVTDDRSADAMRMTCFQRCRGDSFVVRGLDGVAGRAGARVAVEGTLSHVETEAGNGTALVLHDGAIVWLDYGRPPKQWDDYVDREVRLIGTLWDGPPPDRNGDPDPTARVAPHLVDYERPIPLHDDEEPLDTGAP